jgi:hypothetical protein
MPLEQRIELRLTRHQSVKPLQHAMRRCGLLEAPPQGCREIPSAVKALGRAIPQTSDRPIRRLRAFFRKQPYAK